MVTKISSEKRHLADHGWLQTYHLFSFADYHDPHNMNFGMLRVFNDDTIAAETGFGEHHHDNMEIVTIVLQGELTHRDSIGNTGTIRAGEVQYMSAGTGVIHAEMNQSDKPVHLYQIWILPTEYGLQPDYGQKDFSNISNKNILLPVISGEPTSEALSMHTNATIYTSHLEKDHTIKHVLDSGQGLFIYITEGSLDINGTPFEAFDQARITGHETITIEATKDCRFVAIETALS